MLDPHEFLARIVERTQDFVELGLHRGAVAVLAVLDEEYREKGQHCRRGVDDQLPGVGISQQRPTRRPQGDEQDRDDESQRLAQGARSEEHTSELQSLMRITYA